MSEPTARREGAEHRAERVRDALLEWDERAGSRELPDERVAEMRATVLRAARSGSSTLESVSRSTGAAAGSWIPAPRLAFAAAGVALLVAVGTWWSRREAPGVLDTRTPQVVAEQPTGPEVGPGTAAPQERAPAVQPETSLAQQGGDEPPPAPAVDAGNPPPPARRSPLRVAALEPTRDIDDDRAQETVENSTAEPRRRVRRLELEAPSGRKIQWILDSEFTGVGGL